MGVIANPASARDIRRLVAHGGAVTTHEKLNRLQRLLSGLAAAGIERVISMVDWAGISAGLLRLSERASAAAWPSLEFVDQEITQTAADTTAAAVAMVKAGVGAIVVLGGDGTNRLVAGVSGAVPLVSISTGTNNAFPKPVEPTVAGLAAGLVARDSGVRSAGTYRCKKLELVQRNRREIALVDIAVTNDDRVGSGAVWNTTSISELFLTFAEADRIGLSAIGAHVQPVGRREPQGLALGLSASADLIVHPPVAPGLCSPIGVRSVTKLAADVPLVVEAQRGVVAIDGERMHRFGPDDQPTVTLRANGPVVVDVAATLDHAAASGLLASTTSKPHLGD